MKKKILSFTLAFLFCFGSIGMLAVAGGHEHIHAATSLTGKTVTDTTVAFDVPDAGYFIKCTETGVSLDAGYANAGKVTFTGLTAGTEYTFTFYQKVSPTDFTVGTQKVQTLTKMNSPSAPSLSAVTSTTVAINSYVTNQYCIKAGAETPAETDWKDGTADTYTFSGLTAGTAYKVYARTKGTAGVSVNSDPSAALDVTTVGELSAIDFTGAMFSFVSATNSYALVLRDTDTTHEYKIGSGNYTAATASGVPFTVALGSTYTITGRIAAVDAIYGAGKETSRSITLPGVTVSASLTGTVAKLTYTINANTLPLSGVTIRFQLFEGISELTSCEKQGSVASIAVDQFSGGTLESDVGSVSGTLYYKATITGQVNGTGDTVTLYATPSTGATLGTSAHEHTYSNSWSKDSSGHWYAATCEHTSEKSAFAAHTDTNKDGKCDVCGYVISAACQHELTHYLRKEATETTPGHYEYWQCIKCHKYFASASGTANTEITLAETVIPAKGHTTHTPVLQPKVDATCTADGHTAYYKCSCGKCFSDAAGKNEITESSTVIKAHHDLTHKSVLYATPDTAGYQEHWYCEACHKTFRDEAGTQEFDPAVVKHTHIYLTGSDVCNVSGCGYVKNTHTHDFIKKVETDEYLKSAATCTDPAKYYYSCSCGISGTSTFDSTLHPALGHDWKDGVCTRCHVHQSGTGGISHKNFDSTKTACPYCGRVDWGNRNIEISPCSPEAKNTGAAYTYTCQNCDKTVAVTWEPEECTGTHHYGQRIQLPSFAWVQICEYCGTQTLCEDQSCSHSKLDWTLATPDADCEVAASWTYVCRVCHSTNFVTHKASSHVWDNGVVTTPATDTTAGVKTYTCAVCQKTRTEEIAPLKHVHNYGNWIAEVPATCSAEGVKGHYTCSCGMNFDEAKNEITSLTIAKLSHTFGAVTTVASTCTTAGYEEKTCTACGYKDRVNLPLAKHTEKVTTTPATCISAGSDIVTCAVCGQVLENRSIPATGVHSFSGDGDDAKKCVVCGFRYETKVSKGTVYMTFSEAGASLTVPSMTPDALTYQAIKKNQTSYESWMKVLSDAKAISDSAEFCTAYVLDLENNNVDVALSSDAKVELTLPEEYKKNTVKVFASTASGMVAVDSPDRNGDKVSFNAASGYTGEFLIISDSAAKTGNPVVPIVIGIVVVLTIAGVGGYFLYKKGFFTV